MGAWLGFSRSRFTFDSKMRSILNVKTLKAILRISVEAGTHFKISVGVIL